MATPCSNHAHTAPVPQNGLDSDSVPQIPNTHPNGTHISVSFLGTGTSSANPHLDCLLGLTSDPRDGGCPVCQLGMQGQPEDNKNYRCNPSMLIRFEKDGETKHVQIDAGKTFRESALRWYRKLGIPNLDALIVTHEHADSVLGIDDLRMVQKRDNPIDVFLSKQCFKHVRGVFNYLVRSEPVDLTDANTHQAAAAPASLTDSATFIAALNWNLIATPDVNEPFRPFSAAGLEVTPLPVWHGENFLSLGFMFGKTKKFVYISDISAFPGPTLELLKSVEIEYLVLDCLHRERKYPTHMSLQESLKTVDMLKPKNTFFVGMSHDFDHDVANAELTALEGFTNVQLAHDGFTVPLMDFEY